MTLRHTDSTRLRPVVLNARIGTADRPDCGQTFTFSNALCDVVETQGVGHTTGTSARAHGTGSVKGPWDSVRKVGIGFLYQRRGRGDETSEKHFLYFEEDSLAIMSKTWRLCPKLQHKRVGETGLQTILEKQRITDDRVHVSSAPKSFKTCSDYVTLRRRMPFRLSSQRKAECSSARYCCRRNEPTTEHQQAEDILLVKVHTIFRQIESVSGPNAQQPK